MKWGHLCQGIFKCSQEAMKKVGLIHVLTGGTMNFWTGPNSKYSKTESEHLQLPLVRDFLVTNHIQPRLAFCHQHQSKFYKQHIQAFPFVFKNTWFLFPLWRPQGWGVGGYTFDCCPNLCFLNCNSETPNKCFCTYFSLASFLCSYTVYPFLCISCFCITF